MSGQFENWPNLWPAVTHAIDERLCECHPAKTTGQKVFSAGQMIEMSGATRGQIQSWRQRGMLPNDGLGKGNKRVYTARQVALICDVVKAHQAYEKSLEKMAKAIV